MKLWDGEGDNDCESNDSEGDESEAREGGGALGTSLDNGLLITATCLY